MSESTLSHPPDLSPSPYHPGVELRILIYTHGREQSLLPVQKVELVG